MTQIRYQRVIKNDFTFYEMRDWLGLIMEREPILLAPKISKDPESISSYNFTRKEKPEETTHHPTPPQKISI
jgi:hypothetical protein